MTAAALIQSIGSVGFFTTRAFTPAFLTALLLKYGHEIPFIDQTGFISTITDVPTWFTHDITVTVLGVLAVLEVMATKNADARQLLEDVDPYLKSGMTLATTLGILSVTDQQVLHQIIGPQPAGFLDYPIALFTAGLTYVLASARSGVVSVLSDADEDDDSGIQRLLSWGEDIWVAGGLLFLLLFPIVMLILIGIVSGLIMLARKYVEHREESSKVACTNCGQMMYPSALACPNCRTANASPCTVGFLGGSNPGTPAGDLATHQLRLVEKKRCPVCAGRLTERAVRQHCPACSSPVIPDDAFAQRYMNHVGARLPLVCGVGFLLSLIPVIGLIPGVVYYRLALVAPFRRYLPFGRRFFLKWGIRLLFFILIAFQWVPLAGGVVVPLMALISYLAYRSAYEGMLQQPLAASRPPSTAALPEPARASISPAAELT